MNPHWFIAFKYFFSTRKLNAINIISAVSVLSVVTITAAIICVLSVMNGFEKVIKDMCCQFDPQYKILPKTGKYILLTDTIQEQLRRTEEIEDICKIIEEAAIIQYKNFQSGARLMGIDENFQNMTRIDQLITDGYYSVFDGAFNRAVLGRGLAHTIGTNAHFVDGIKIYVPQRLGKINMLAPAQSIRTDVVFIAGTFAVNQAKYDDEIMCISLPLAQQLLQLDTNTVSYLGLKVKPTCLEKNLRHKLANIFHNNIIIQNQYEQQEEFYKMVKIEKLMSAVLLLFILLIASFHIISSLYMVIIDKHKTIHTLYTLGMTHRNIQKTFFLEGWLISFFGGGVGVLVGCLLCFFQQHFGWLKIGNGDNYVISAYPVDIQTADIILTFCFVFLFGTIMASIPASKIKSIKNYW